MWWHHFIVAPITMFIDNDILGRQMNQSSIFCHFGYNFRESELSSVYYDSIDICFRAMSKPHFPTFSNTPVGGKQEFSAEQECLLYFIQVQWIINQCQKKTYLLLKTLLISKLETFYRVVTSMGRG